MMFGEDQRIEKIIESHLAGLISGRETIDWLTKSYPKYAKKLRPRIEAALWLVDARNSCRHRQGFITSTRTNLEQRISSLPKQSAWQLRVGRYTPQRWVFNLTAPVLLFLILALVLNNLVLTARLAIPGDSLYSAKLAAEDIQLALTFNPEKKTDLYIQFSRERTTEFVELVLEGNYTLLPMSVNRMETDIIAALRSMDDPSLSNPAVELPMITQLQDSLANEIILLNVLKRTSPSTAQQEINLAIQAAQSGVIALR